MPIYKYDDTREIKYYSRFKTHMVPVNKFENADLGEGKDYEDGVACTPCYIALPYPLKDAMVNERQVYATLTDISFPEYDIY